MNHVSPFCDRQSINRLNCHCGSGLDPYNSEIFINIFAVNMKLLMIIPFDDQTLRDFAILKENKSETLIDATELRF